MRWSVTIGRFGETALKVHVTFLLLLAWIGFSAWRQEGPAAALQSVLFLFFLFVCVTLHEFGHILVARRYGVKTPEVTLLPIGGVASLETMPDKPAQELAIAIAGPMVNVVIAILLFLVLGKIEPDYMTRLDDSHISLLARLAAANVFLVVFNLIPAFPMDGGRVLRALLAMKLGPRRATRIAATIGQALAFGLGFLGLFGNPLLIFIAIFVYVAAAGEAQMAAVHDSVQGLRIEDAMETRFATIPANARLSDAVETMVATGQHEFPVVDGAGKPVGLIVRDDIHAALKDNREGEVIDLVRNPIETVAPDAALEGALDHFTQKRGPALCVADRDGRLVGLLTRESLAEVMMIKAMRPTWTFRQTRPSAKSLG